MSKAVVTDVVFRNGKPEIVDPVVFVAKVKAAKWGDGQALVMRIEPEEDAYTYGQLKYLFGYVIEPVMKESGHTKLELAAMAKTQFMPEGKKSITELTREELDAFTLATEQWLREEMPQAFEERRQYVG